MNDNHAAYDIIGDIHGHADALRMLLSNELGYVEKAGEFSHAERKAIFVGDFIDRGPKIRETLEIVHRMVSAGHALAVLGNHEFNAICYHTNGPDGQPLRVHSEKNRHQHEASLDQVAPDEWRKWIHWFRHLPLFLDLGKLRVVHASWCAASIADIGVRRLDDDGFLFQAASKRTRLGAAVEKVLKGPEIPLASGCTFTDHEGNCRKEIRVRWFGSVGNARQVTYRDLTFPRDNRVPSVPVPDEELQDMGFYAPSEPPVVFGHYWLPPVPRPTCEPNATCVDFSVAKEGGQLAAYRWSGEDRLCDKNLVSVRRSPEVILKD